MSFKCEICKEEFSYDEVIALNCNDDVVLLDEHSIELNAQNPDYISKVYCDDCYAYELWRYSNGKNGR